MNSLFLESDEKFKEKVKISKLNLSSHSFKNRKKQLKSVLNLNLMLRD